MKEGLLFDHKKTPIEKSIQRREEDEKTKALVQYQGQKTPLAAPTLSLEGHSDEVTSAKFKEDGSILATGGYDKMIMLWSIGNETKEVGSIKDGGPILDLDWGKTETQTQHQLISVTSNTSCCLWDTNTGEKIRRYKDHQNHINSVSASFHEPGFRTASDDGYLRTFDTRTKKMVNELSLNIPLLSLKTTHYFTIVGTLMGDLIWYDPRKMNEQLNIKKAHRDMITGINGNDNYIVTCGRDAAVKVWNGAHYTTKPNRLTAQMMGAKIGEDRNLIRCSIDPTHRMIAVGSSDHFVYIFNRIKKKIMYRLPGHKGVVNAIAFHPTLSIIASVGSDAQVIVGELS